LGSKLFINFGVSLKLVEPFIFKIVLKTSFFAPPGISLMLNVALQYNLRMNTVLVLISRVVVNTLWRRTVKDYKLKPMFLHRTYINN